MFDCMQNDETPIIVINGGYTAFEEQLDKYGPYALMNNLKDTSFIQRYGKISVSDNMFEFPNIDKMPYRVSIVTN